jgi:hypothetical protein
MEQCFGGLRGLLATAGAFHNSPVAKHMPDNVFTPLPQGILAFRVRYKLIEELGRTEPLLNWILDDSMITSRTMYEETPRAGQSIQLPMNYNGLAYCFCCVFMSEFIIKILVAAALLALK